jgi:hypothetical protein
MSSRLPVRHASRSRSRLVILVLLALVTGALLAVPPSASAHITKKYRKGFLMTIGVIATEHMNWDVTEEGQTMDLQTYATEMLPLFDSQDPNAQQKLEIDKELAKLIADQHATYYKQLRKAWWHTIEVSLYETFCAKKYFALVADRRNLRKYTHALEDASDDYCEDVIIEVSEQARFLSEAEDATDVQDVLAVLAKMGGERQKAYLAFTNAMDDITRMQ